MEIETTLTLIASETEKRQDKEYHLKCYRLKQAVQNLNRISIKIACGELYPDKEYCAVVDGFRWKK